METVTLGTATRKIAVASGTVLAGFRDIERICNGADAPDLEINVLYCESGLDRVVVVSVDMVLVNELYRRLIPLKDEIPADIYVVASHTHYSPGLSPEYAELGTFCSEFCNYLVCLAKSAIHQAIEHSKTTKGQATVSDWTTRYAKASTRRRLGFVKKKKFPFFSYEIVMEPKFVNPVDFPLTLCAVEMGGCLEALLWTFPCHPTNYYDKFAASSEYIGFVRDRLRQAYGAELPVLFFQGASGDVRQPFQSRNWRRIGINRCAKAVLSGLRSTYHAASRKEWEAWAASLASEASLCAARALNGPKNKMSINISKASSSVSTFLGESHPVTTVNLDRLQLADSVEILIVNAEITQKLGEKLIGTSLNHSGEKILATCSNECLGYMCTTKEFAEGGYEAKNWPEAFGCNSQITDQAETLLSRLNTLLRE